MRSAAEEEEEEATVALLPQVTAREGGGLPLHHYRQSQCPKPGLVTQRGIRLYYPTLASVKATGP